MRLHVARAVPRDLPAGFAFTICLPLPAACCAAYARSLCAAPEGLLPRPSVVRRLLPQLAGKAGMQRGHGLAPLLH